MLDLKENSTRYIGIKNNYIQVVSDKEFTFNNLKIVKLPKEFENVSSEELITNYRYSNNELKAKKSSKPFDETKIAFVGNFKMKCGISTYSENLWPEIAKQSKDFKLFIEENEFPTSSIYEFGNEILSEDKVCICWKRGANLTKLVKEIKEYDPDIVFFQHEWGLFPTATHWLSLMNQLSEYRVIVTMHSVFHHKDKTICEAAIPEIVVHLEGAQNVLKNEKQISSTVHVIPHGCQKIDDHKLWNIYKSNHTIIQTGFLFRYKGWEESLKAIYILKSKYPDIFFTGICSESPFNMVEHQLYYNELMLLVEDLQIQENVCLIRGYQSDQVIDSYLRTNKIAIFPYTSNKEHEVFGVSGAARYAMTRGLPVVSSNGNHFTDIPSIKTNSAHEMADQIDKLLSDKNFYTAQIAKQNSYINDNSWEEVANKYINIFENET